MIIRRLPSQIVVAAAVVTCSGLMFGTGAVPARWLDSGRSPGVVWLAIGCLVVWLAELCQIRARIGATFVELTWGEAAFIVLCYFLPAGWITSAVLVGVCGAYTTLGLFDQRRTTTHILRSTATLTVAAGAGVVVARAIAPTYGQPLSPRNAVALLAGALTYALVGMYLTALQLLSADATDRAATDASALFRRLVRAKLLMLLGNVTIGLLVVTVEGSSRRWLVLLLPPVAWLLQQAYGYRLRLDDERWTWRLFAEVTRELNRLDERDAAVAGINGALRLFPAIAAEVVVYGENGIQNRVYTAERNGRVTDLPLQQPAALVWRRSLPIEPRPLVVGGVRIGEMKLRLARPVRFSRRDRHMLAAYGDALAAALHDAATHDELRLIAERGVFEAVHDPLTGVANRNALLVHGGDLIGKLPDRTPVALLLLDIDHFKEVNNALGHAAGDELLQIIAQRLVAAARADELLARLGGDEFAILLTGHCAEIGGTADEREDPLLLKAALARAGQFAEQIAAPTTVSGVVLSVEASVGVVAAVAGDIGMTELLRRADIAMYQAKRGAQQVALYEPARDEASVDRLALLAEVRAALAASDQFVLVVQPAVALDTGCPVGAEVLVRWDHPRRGRLGPADFLEAVEHSELVGTFTRYVLDQALRIAAGWAAAGIDAPIAVNLSARSLLDRGLVDDLPGMLERHGVAPSRLTLEITESVVLTELSIVEEVLAAVRGLGVRLAVDDFGSGFSSLTFLTRVPVDEVKIDRTFVSRMVESAEAAAIVRTTVDLGRRLGLRVVAEGVETAAQRAALRSLGCSTAQGFHFYRPLSPERATLVLLEGAPAGEQAG